MRFKSLSSYLYKNTNDPALSNQTALISSTGERFSWTNFLDLSLRWKILLEDVGILSSDRVAIWTSNRPEWFFADQGAMMAGAITVPIYSTLAAREIAYILDDCSAKTIVVENNQMLDLLKNHYDALSSLESIIVLDCNDEDLDIKISNKKVVYWGSLAERPIQDMKAATKTISKIENGFDTNVPATIIYTSGTTGDPKGVVLTHSNFISNFISVSAALPMGSSDRHLSFLPLSHVFERTCGYYLMVHLGATIAFTESIETVLGSLAEVRPSFLLGVPRFYEKIMNGVLDQIRSKPQWLASFLQKRLIAVQKATGNPRIDPVLSLLVGRKLKKKLGSNIRFCVSGGAPLSPEIARFFYGLGILILEGYGLTETSPVISCNRPDAFRFGTVGKIIKGVETKVSDSGELLTRGQSVMQGYFNNKVATENVIENGWFHTGDVAEISSDGYLKITGRIKEIIVLSGGKKVSPHLIEPIYEDLPHVSRCCLFGEGKNFLTAFIVPADVVGNPIDDAIKLEDDALEDMIQKEIQMANKKIARYEQIKYFVMLSRDFSLESGELTPTLKIRRKIVNQKYGSLLEDFYEKNL